MGIISALSGRCKSNPLAFRILCHTIDAGFYIYPAERAISAKEALCFGYLC
jgi:hypothetical protein